MHMTDVSTQVFDRRIGALMKIPVWMMDIPEYSQFIIGIFIHQTAQPGSIRIDAAGLDKQRDLLRNGSRQQFVD